MQFNSLERGRGWGDWRRGSGSAAHPPPQVSGEEVPLGCPPTFLPPPTPVPSPLLSLPVSPSLRPLTSHSLCDSQELQSAAPFVLLMRRPKSKERGRNRVTQLDCFPDGETLAGGEGRQPPPSQSIQEGLGHCLWPPQHPCLVRDAIDNGIHSFDHLY